MEGRWEARVSLPTGKTKSLYGKTRREVRDKLKNAIKDLDAGLDLSARNETVGTLFDDWLETVRPSLRPKTRSPSPSA